MIPKEFSNRIRSFVGLFLEGLDSYVYPDVPTEDTQPEVSEAIERFRSLSDKERAEKPLLYWLLGDGTPPFKVSAEDSQYVDESKFEERCSNCEFLYFKPTSEVYVCSQIRPYVQPEGWCNRWQQADYEKDTDR